jgi:hypothetical protein
MAQQPPVGTPLAGNAPTNADWGAGQWTGAGGGPQAQQFYAWQDFAKTFGRNPTQAELDQYSAYYASPGDPNRANIPTGNQAIASYYQQQNAPSAIDLQNQQVQQAQGAYTSQKGTINPQLGQMWQSMLGRAPTQDEMTHFGSLLASGQTDPYELQNYLKQTPEYANSQDAQFRQQLGGQMNDINGQFFSRYIQPSVMSQFASSGRDVSGASTGLQYALANAAKDLQLNSQQYLTGLGAQQYQGRQGVATQGYEAQLGQQYGVQNASLGNAISNQNNQLGQNWASTQYGRQSNDLMNYLRNLPKQGSNPFTSALSGALSGAALGTGKGGPGWGTAIGAAGGGLFGYGAGGGF